MGISCMSAGTTTQQIADFINEIGKMTVKKDAIYIPYPNSNRKQKAEVRCGSNSNAQKLVKKLNLKKLGGSTVFVEIAEDLKGKTKVLQLTDLKEGVTEQDLANVLQRSKKIKNPPKKIKANKDSAKITFETIEEAEQGYDVLKGSKLKGKKIVVRRFKKVPLNIASQLKKQRKTMMIAVKKVHLQKEKGKKVALTKVLKNLKESK